MRYIAFVVYAAMIVFLLIVIGCAAHTVVNPTSNVVIRNTSDVDVLRKHVAKISEKGTFPALVESLKKSMHNPDRFEFIRAESMLREQSHKRPSGIHIKYYYLIRLHFRGENAFGALRLSHQDYHLHPNGKIIPISKKK